MNPLRVIMAIFCITFCGHAFAQEQDIDTALSALADKLSVQVKDQGKKKVAVVDFTDLQGTTLGELGKYIAEELTVDLVMVKRDFSVLDRANLNRILAEHKLTSQGLVDPENAKKIGQFAGVDALILGTIIPKGSNAISLSTKIITTDTAEIVGASRAEFKADNAVQQLISKPNSSTAPTGASGFLQDDNTKVIKTFGDLRVEIESLKIVNKSRFMLTFTLINQNTNKSIWTAVSYSLGGRFLRGSITDSEGHEFTCTDSDLSGVEYAWNNPPMPITRATEIKPKDSATVTIKFSPSAQTTAAAGPCRLQLELLLSHDFRDRSGTATVQNLIANIEAH
jgi:TolB-like protein